MYFCNIGTNMNISYFLICTFTILINHVICSVDETVVRARVESCPGCQLNRLTEVKQFIFEDVPKYDNVEFKRIPGAPPELVFLNEADEEVERLPLKSFNRQECNELLKKRDFVMRDDKKEL